MHKIIIAKTATPTIMIVVLNSSDSQIPFSIVEIRTRIYLIDTYKHIG